MTAVLYSGAENLTFPGYIDLVTGRTLAAEPGGTYDVMPVNAGDPEMPADGRFALVFPGDEESATTPVSPEEETPDGEER